MEERPSSANLDEKEQPAAPVEETTTEQPATDNETKEQVPA